MRFTKTQIAYALLIVCASARLLLQMAAMPPYAGLDEVYHVARLAFVRAEHRNPTTTRGVDSAVSDGRSHRRRLRTAAASPDASLPCRDACDGRSGRALARDRCGARPHVIVDRPFDSADLKPYVVKNYEAQQTSLYYSLAAPLVPIRSALFELRVWRAMSLLFALITVLATAEIGRRWLGPIGILGGAILVSLPTWETLVMRAGNDAFACMLAAVAVLISVCAPRRPLGIAAEAIVWGAGAEREDVHVAAADHPAVSVVASASAEDARDRGDDRFADRASLLTFAELSSRTRNPLGVVAFDRPGGVVYEAKVSISEIVRVTIAQRSRGRRGSSTMRCGRSAIALYLGPILIAVLVALRRRTQRASRRDASVPGARCAFALAQAYNVVACVLARRGGNAIPIGGKEGWYWYVLAPVVIPALLVPALKRWRAAAWWIVIWDVIITEGALFHDFAGIDVAGARLDALPMGSAARAVHRASRRHRRRSARRVDDCHSHRPSRSRSSA